ncbi:MAG: pyruvate kinase [bacterium P3]|nr:MAG: pyruvate kinase [bacterium P3]KWW40939.1 MAG: pyruvate kinase [bacterium F083]
MKKTKIVTSIGPASYNPDIFERMVVAGANVARINFSHATDEEKQKAVAAVREVRRRTGRTIGIMYDTKGPELRNGAMRPGGALLCEGRTVRIVRTPVEGDAEHFSLNHPQVLDNLRPGHRILLENGLMELSVVSCEPDGVTCRVDKGGNLESRKSVSVPGVPLGIPFLSDADRADIIYACSHDGDILACSFVSSADDVRQVRQLLAEQGRSDMRVIAKIESQTGIANLDSIVLESDGLMVARGDLGVEAPMEDLPVYQKRIVRTCRQHNKVCIIATEMLESMKHNSRPTRAEVTDIANAVYLGADAVMLSGETTTGQYPVEAVAYMARICEHIENSHEYANVFAKGKATTIAESMCYNVAASANELRAKVIMVPTKRGVSARLLSNLEPSCPIMVLTEDEHVERGLSLNYGVYTLLVDSLGSTDTVLEQSRRVAVEWLSLQPGDIIITCGGFHNRPTPGESNFMTIETV